MSTFLFKVCAADRSSSTLFNEYQHLTHVHTKALVARAAAATARLRRPRADRAPATPLQKRRRLHGCHSLHRLLQRRFQSMMAPNQEIRRRSSAADRNPLTTTPPPIATTAATTTTFASAADNANMGSQPRKDDNVDTTTMPPPPTPGRDERSPTRQSRSTSTASRNANRLSLTLPIAPPSSDPSRPTPTYATTGSSVCPTPVESSATASPSDTNEFIIAIAAQERRVLELKEELARAESELVTLKRQWSSQEGYSKKAELRAAIETPRKVATGADDESITSRRSVDLDRRKSLLLQNQNTPTQSRRGRVLRGGHARTLSLLSPQKPDAGFSNFAVHEDREQGQESIKLPPVNQRTAQLTNATLAKRASWQPQSSTYPNSVPGLVEDFRLGLKAFVEDIRQITVGDEPITGNTPRSHAGDSMGRDASDEHDTIRPSHSARPKVSNVFDSPVQETATPTSSSKSQDGSADKGKSRRSKHFSWTPLSFDSLDDNGWSNWESPASVKSTRWSGSTVNNGGVEDIESIPEAREDTDEHSKGKLSTVDAPLLSPRLGEILPSMVNRLTPSNIKKATNTLMEEWERSLAIPEPSADKENGA